jgi:hypothetical protein
VQRLLELAILEGDGRLVRDGLQQPQVIAAEARPLAEPVDDGRARSRRSPTSG